MNTDQLEHDLRDALATRAAELPATAGARVRAHDYRPRTRSLRPPVAAGALTAAAAAGAAVWISSLTTDTPAAFAGWRATPTAAAPGQVTAAESACERRVANGPGRKVPSGGPPAPTVSDVHPVLTDTRGPFTWVILGGARATASCISGSHFTDVSAGVSVAPRPRTPAGSIALSLAAWSQAPVRDGGAYSFAEGRTGAGVTAATLVLDDGTHVKATLQNGWFAAWWPGTHTARSAIVTTASGTRTQQLSTRDRPAGCPPPKAGARARAHGSSTCMSTGGKVGHGSGQSFGFSRRTTANAGG